MKYLAILFLLISVICFSVVGLMFNLLSFIDYPYLYSGVIFLTLSVILYFKYK